MSKTETLNCEAGHSWSRTSTRGRKPKVCPKHKGDAAQREPKPAAAHTPTPASIDHETPVSVPLTAALTGSERAAALMVRMAPIIIRDRKRRART